jgi:PEGA domain
MSVRKIMMLGVSFLLVTLFVNAASRNNSMRIKVLDSQTRPLSLDDNNGVPLNCEQLTFDAYCRSSRTVRLQNTLLVQEGDGAPFRISCTIESKFSRCTPLPKGATFEARREKKGIVVYYVDDKGKARSELYTLVAGDGRVGTAAAATTAASAATTTAAAGATTTAPQPAPAPVKNVGQAPAPATESLRETVKCSFSSTPSGADVTLDGRFVGSTPSVLGVTTGTHVVVVSMAGFAQWKREFSVTPGSELTVNAVLQKAQ